MLVDMKLRYLHLDVFTGNRFEGNQLAVFPEPPPDIDPGLMRTIAAEMNYSESTFVFPPTAGGDVRMRIFTPANELPIAGHPTVGTTFALAADGAIASGRERFVFELGVGPTPVSLEWKNGSLDFAWMTQPLPSFGPELQPAAFAPALGIEAEDLVTTLVAQPISCGVPFLFVPVESRAAMDRVAIDRRAYAAACSEAGINQLPVFLFTTDRAGSQGDELVYSRMLAPGFGIAEDPATGAASGPLGCYLFHHRVVPGERARSLVSLQGVAMGRPSRIHISIDTAGDSIRGVRVGGQAVMVGSGALSV
jgi:trans-2,3-dihydro-3-hydroxyanthranilate isomerase